MKSIALTILVVGCLIFWAYSGSKDGTEQALARANDLISSSQQHIEGREYTASPTDHAKTYDTEPTQLTAQQLFIAARELRHCRAIPTNDTELSLWLDNANQVGEPGEYIDDVLARYEHCSSNKPADHNYVVLLLQAAEQGYDDAVGELWALGDTEYFESQGLEQLNRGEMIAARAEFTAKKYQLAHKVALVGGEQSLERLIKGYQHLDPVTGGQNYMKALGYADFALLTTQNNDFYRKADWFKQRLSQRMNHEELLQAQLFTESLLVEAAHGSD